VRRAAALLIAAGLSCACAGAPVVAVKPGFDLSRAGRVALLDFADLQGQSGSGASVSQALEPYLLQAGYSLVERSQVRRVLQEQALGGSGLVASEAAQTLGRMLAVDALVLGTVTGFVPEVSQVYMQTVSNVSYNPVYETVPVPGRKKGETRSQRVLSHYDVVTTKDQVPAAFQTPASVAFSARLVDAATGEVLWTGSSSSEGGTAAEAANAAAKRLVAALRKAAKS
jgi:curli biogenesis system outer membrane secretion channel CsgG